MTVRHNVSILTQQFISLKYGVCRAILLIGVATIYGPEDPEFEYILQGLLFSLTSIKFKKLTPPTIIDFFVFSHFQVEHMLDINL